MAIKIDSPITATDPGTSRGLMVLADNQDFITFALTTDGTNISLTARTVTAGVATTVFNQASFNEYHNPICLRLARTGTAYTAYYSPDGVVWVQAATCRRRGADFDRALRVQLQQHAGEGCCRGDGYQLVRHPVMYTGAGSAFVPAPTDVHK